jgi:hypothetical protein
LLSRNRATTRWPFSRSSKHPFSTGNTGHFQQAGAAHINPNLATGSGGGMAPGSVGGPAATSTFQGLPNAPIGHQGFVPASQLLNQAGAAQPFASSNDSNRPPAQTAPNGIEGTTVSPESQAAPSTHAGWHDVLSPNQVNTPVGSLKNQQTENLAAFTLEQRYFAKPESLPPVILVEINGEVKEVIKVTKDGLLPSSIDVSQGLTTLLLLLGICVGADVTTHLVFDPTKEKLKNDNRFHFLFLISPAILSSVTADRPIVYPTGQLQALRLALFDKLYPQGHHKLIPGVPPFLKQCNIRPLSINALDSSTIGFLTVPPEFIQGSKYDSQAHQYIGSRFITELREQLKQENPLQACPIPVIHPVRLAELISVRPYPAGQRQKSHQSLSRHKVRQFSNDNTLMAVTTSTCEKGRHLICKTFVTP